MVSFSALQRAEIAEMWVLRHTASLLVVSVLFNEPKLLKFQALNFVRVMNGRFSALQRAEIAEIIRHLTTRASSRSFSALQRAEIAEIVEIVALAARDVQCFSALQRAEIAEIGVNPQPAVLDSGFQCSSTSRNC